MNRTPVPLWTDVDGVRIAGFYAIQSDMVTVWHPLLGSRTRRIDGGWVNAQLTELLAEVVRAHPASTRRAVRARP